MISKPRVVGLDLGSNTFSCVELSLDDDGLPIVTGDTSRSVRLSTNLKAGGPLDKSAIYRGLEVLEKLHSVFRMDRYPVRAVGTQALRMTSTPEHFTVPAREILGVDVEILSGEEEALLASRGAMLGLSGFDSAIIVDVGGQSTEVCWREDGGGWIPMSLATGVVGLTERFLHDDPPTREQLDEVDDFLSGIFSKAVPDGLKGRLVGVAGTATTLARVELGLDRWDRERVHGIELTADRVNHWLEVICGIAASERTVRFGISPARADIFPAGLCILRALLRHLDREVMTVSANGLRVGAAISILQKE